MEEHPTYNTPAAKVTPSMVITTSNLATGRPIRAIDSADTYGPDMANDGNFRNSWYLPEGLKEGWLEVELDAARPFNTLVLAEPVGRWKDYPRSRIARYRFEAWDGSAWKELAAGVGQLPVRMHAIQRTTSGKVRLTLWAGSETPHVSEIGVYDEPQ